MSDSPLLAVSTLDSVGIIELARPAVFNCLSTAVFTAIEAAMMDFETRAEIRSIVIRGQGKHFCTGAELGEVKQVRQVDEQLARFLAHGHRILERIEASPLPVIASVHGLCLAGGLELALACDLVFAAASARFGDQHAQFGLVPGWGGSQRLPRAIGLKRAFDLFFSARWIDAATAEQWGLVNRVIADEALAAETLAYAGSLGERSRAGLTMMKRLAREGFELPLDQGLRLEERDVAPLLRGEDVSEGLAAFEQRRAPRFA